MLSGERGLCGCTGGIGKRASTVSSPTGNVRNDGVRAARLHMMKSLWCARVGGGHLGGVQIRSCLSQRPVSFPVRSHNHSFQVVAASLCAMQPIARAVSERSSNTCSTPPLRCGAASHPQPASSFRKYDCLARAWRAEHDALLSGRAENPRECRPWTTNRQPMRSTSRSTLKGTKWVDTSMGRNNGSTLASTSTSLCTVLRRRRQPPMIRKRETTRLALAQAAAVPSAARRAERRTILPRHVVDRTRAACRRSLNCGALSGLGVDAQAPRTTQPTLRREPGTHYVSLRSHRF